MVIESHTDIGEGCRISQFASIGGAPQDLKYRGEETRVVIGNHNTIREYVTINRATISDIGVTIIGDHNLLMAYCHVAHNCKLGNHIVMANAANLAGHIHVEDFAIIGGLTGIHQFTRIGAHCIIGGASAVTKDIPPFVMASGNFAKLLRFEHDRPEAAGVHRRDDRGHQGGLPDRFPLLIAPFRRNQEGRRGGGRPARGPAVPRFHPKIGKGDLPMK